MSGPITRVAVTYTGDPDDPAVWSGTPHQIVQALRREVEVLPVSVLPPGRWEHGTRDLLAAPQMLRERGGLRSRVHRARQIAGMHPLAGRLHSVVAHRRLHGAQVDGVVKIGSNYSVPGRFVTYDDMTVAQGVALTEIGLDALPPRRLEQRRAEQARGYREAVAACFATGWPADSAVADYGIARDHVRVVGIGPGFQPTRADRSWRDPVFTFIGRQWEVKGGPVLLAAFALVRRTHPTARLVLVGGGAPPHSAHVAGVEVVGAVDVATAAGAERLQRVWDETTCLVQPSRFEAAGKVFLEARHAGVPSIGSSRGGARHLIGAAGEVVPPDEVGSLVDAMCRYADPATAERAGALAHDRSAEATWSHVATGLLAALRGEVGR